MAPAYRTLFAPHVGFSSECRNANIVRYLLPEVSATPPTAKAVSREAVMKNAHTRWTIAKPFMAHFDYDVIRTVHPPRNRHQQHQVLRPSRFSRCKSLRRKWLSGLSPTQDR
jgi:hypothetical protein